MTGTITVSIDAYINILGTTAIFTRSGMIVAAIPTALTIRLDSAVFSGIVAVLV
jgi:hypothetical protein